MDIVNKHEVHGKSYRKLAAEYGVSGSGCLRTFLTVSTITVEITQDLTWLIRLNSAKWSRCFCQRLERRGKALNESLLCNKLCEH